jgi:hypothetical protein
MSAAQWFGFAALLVGVYAAIAAVYLRKVQRNRQSDSTEGVQPSWKSWVRPLIIPGVIIMWLGAAERLVQAYTERSWATALGAVGPLILGFILLSGARELRKAGDANSSPHR